VAAAIMASLKDDGTSMGKTYELGGARQDIEKVTYLL